MADETILTDSYVIKSGINLFVYVKDPNVTFAQVFAILNNPEKTSSITYVNGETETNFTGFTYLFNVCREDEGFYTAGLRKE